MKSLKHEIVLALGLFFAAASFGCARKQQPEPPYNPVAQRLADAHASGPAQPLAQDGAAARSSSQDRRSYIK